MVEVIRIAFIVSAFDRPRALRCLLSSLSLQTRKDFEVIVCDNSPQGMNEFVARDFDREFSKFSYVHTVSVDCYASSNLVARDMTVAEYLCFPSDDGYYAPGFVEGMLMADWADIIHCDCLYNGHGTYYDLLQTAPRLGFIDKGGFLIKRERFFGFPLNNYADADGLFIEEAARRGFTFSKVPGILWAHN